jgi:hypothetical protein
MLWWLDPVVEWLKARRLATATGILLFALFVWGGEWLFDGVRPLCGWNGVFGEIAWCPQPTPRERRLLREEALRQEREDPIEQAILRLIAWFEGNSR